MLPAIRPLLASVSFCILAIASQAQPINNEGEKQQDKPYKLITSARQITIKSITIIKHVMLWTTGGNRVVEQKEINSSSYVLDIPINQKTFFLMIGLNNGKIYTEKIGLRE